MIALRLYNFFQKNRTLLLLLVIVGFAVTTFFSTRIRLEEDITKFIPKDEKTAEINFTLQNLKIKDKFIINIFHKDSSSSDSEELMTCADLLADTLRKAHADYIKDLQYKVSDDLMST